MDYGIMEENFPKHFTLTCIKVEKFIKGTNK